MTDYNKDQVTTVREALAKVGLSEKRLECNEWLLDELVKDETPQVVASPFDGERGELFARAGDGRILFSMKRIQRSKSFSTGRVIYHGLNTSIAVIIDRNFRVSLALIG